MWQEYSKRKEKLVSECTFQTRDFDTSICMFFGTVVLSCSCIQLFTKHLVYFKC